eukprot:g12566.t1
MVSVTFGVAPAVFGFVLADLTGVWDFVCLVVYVLSGVGRLARYNVPYFQGLPIPVGLWIALVLYVDFELSLGGGIHLISDGLYNFAGNKEFAGRTSTSFTPRPPSLLAFGGVEALFTTRTGATATPPVIRLPVLEIFGGKLHFLSLLYLVTGLGFVSTRPVPKPNLNCQKRKDTLPVRSESAKRKLKKAIKDPKAA